MLSIGPYSHTGNVIVAPMAGVTDRPFRALCRSFGSYWAVSEMVTSDQRLWDTHKSRHRLIHDEGDAPNWVQLAGAEPEMIAAAAAANVTLGAQIIDINMGCPAKKVCNKAAGSALLRDETLVRDILAAVVNSVDVPVTLKIRLGWSAEQQNATTIAQIAESEGVSLLTVHGRTRACKFQGVVDYDAIGSVKAAVKIPVIANGDIDSAHKARRVMAQTGCDGLMIGRAAQGRPWLPAEIDHALNGCAFSGAPDLDQFKAMLVGHVTDLHEFYGAYQGIRIARKHVGWALDHLQARDIKARFNRADSELAQFAILSEIDAMGAAA